MADWLNIGVKWAGRTVSGLVVIVGLVCRLIAAGMAMASEGSWGVFLGFGVFFVIIGLIGAILMTAMIRAR